MLSPVENRPDYKYIYYSIKKVIFSFYKLINNE